MKATVFALPVLLAVTLQAETVTLIPVADTAISSQSPDNNYGRFAAVPAGTLSPSQQVARVLLKFDVAAALPAGAIVTNVSLTVHLADSIDWSLDKAALHRLLLDWGEGTNSEGNQTPAAGVGGANWGWSKFGGAMWSHPGIALFLDYASTESGWVNWKQPGSYSFVSLPAMVSDVQGWLDRPGFNFGWLLKSRTEVTETGTGTKLVVTREGPEPQQPRLVIGFTLPSPVEPALAPPKLTGETLELRYQLAPGNLYELRAFATPFTTSFTVLTNHAVKVNGFEATFTEPASATQRFYQLVITGQVD